MKRHFSHFLAAAALCVWSAPAVAATRTVCYEVGFLDGMDPLNCALEDEDGARRHCSPGAIRPAVGAIIELWDKDPTSKDEFIASFQIAGTGLRCATFEWEMNAASKGEANPDVYIKYIFKTRKIACVGCALVEGRDAAGKPVAAASWRDGPSGDADRFVAQNCTTAGPCDIRPGKILLPGGSIASQNGLLAMALDAAQHTLEVFSDAFTDHVKLFFEGSRRLETAGQTQINLPANDDARGGVPHELGHAMQAQLFNIPTLAHPCEFHTLDNTTNDGCATAEGWGDYVQAVSWWNPSNTDALPRMEASPTGGANLEDFDPPSGCSYLGQTERAVAMAFWDLDDTNNEPHSDWNADADDLDDETSLDIAFGWAEFSPGPGDNQSEESTADGVNAKDYKANNAARFSSTFEETFIDHNCLTGQDE